MSNLLIVAASPRGELSVSNNMAAQFAADWPGSIVQRDLTQTPLRFTDAAWLAACFTPPAAQTPDMQATLALSDELVAELLAADVLVIATPVYNYNVPALLKSWFDHIVRKGVTLGCDGAGLLMGKRCVVLLASGGVYTAGSPIADRDLATHWLRLMVNVQGIADVTFVAAGGTKVIDLGLETRADYLAPVVPQVRAAALASAGASAPK